MSQQSVKADRDAQPREQVHHDEDREVVGVDGSIPEQHDRGEHAGERDHYAKQICEAFSAGHVP